MGNLYGPVYKFQVHPDLTPIDIALSKSKILTTQSARMSCTVAVEQLSYKRVKISYHADSLGYRKHLPARPTAVTLPYQILANIVKYCHPSTLFTLTRVDTKFRRLVYAIVPASQPSDIPSELAIHLLNNQKPPKAPKGDTISNLDLDKDDVWVFLTKGQFGYSSVKRKRDCKPCERVYAPEFRLEWYRPALVKPLSIRRLIMKSTEDWFCIVGTSGRKDIDILRRARKWIAG